MQRLPRRRHGQGRNAFFARCVCPLRCVHGPTLQPRNLGRAVQGQKHRADSEHDRGRRAGVFQTGASTRAQAQHPASYLLDTSFNYLDQTEKSLYVLKPSIELSPEPDPPIYPS